jgi:hypothetical protein
MEPLYVGIIVGVAVLAGIIGFFAFTGQGADFNPITIDNVDKIMRPSSESSSSP